MACEQAVKLEAVDVGPWERTRRRVCTSYASFVDLQHRRGQTTVNNCASKHYITLTNVMP